MPKNDLELMVAARDGYDGTLRRLLDWSPMWMAYQAGLWLRQTGRSAPSFIAMSRGYTMHLNGMRVALSGHCGKIPLSVERLS